jgi:hypothetical protein
MLRIGTRPAASELRTLRRRNIRAGNDHLWGGVDLADLARNRSAALAAVHQWLIYQLKGTPG